MKDLSVHIYFVNAVIKQAAAHGFDTERLLQRSRISPRLMHESQARVSAEQYARLQAVTMREMGDEMLGYCSYPARRGQWSALCHWLISCKTLGQALKRYCLFYNIAEGGLQPSLLTDGDRAQLQFAPRPADIGKLVPYAYELFMYSAHRLLCWLTESLPPLEVVTLSYPAPPHVQEYRPLFLGAPTRFDSPQCSFVFKRRLFSRPIVQTPETLATFLRHPLFNILVNPYQSLSWSQRIKDLIGSDLSKLPSFLDIANSLEINPKKLRRLLSEEGLTYSELKLQLRRDIAIYHLSRRDTSVEEIAFNTGFSESSAFIRAFKKWTGVTPYTYRKDLT